MSDTPKSTPRPSLRQPPAGLGFLLAMLACMLAGVLLLNTGALETSIAGFGFLMMIPFALGGLVTGAGLRLFNSAGCIFAPLILFAVIFPFVYFKLAEGLVCILMALPFWLAAGLGGGLAAYLIRRRQGQREMPRANVVALLTLPFALIYAEEASPPAWQERVVVREVTIAASADAVWPLLISIPAIDTGEGKPTFTHDWAGIPRPSEARLVKRAGGLVREAQWGRDIRFEERITKLIPGKAIAWDFAFPDDSVQAYTDRHIAPDGPVLKIASGGYQIKAVGDDRVRLTLHTTYRMRSRLGWYLGWWGEIMLGDVQDNVLAIIKQRAE
ncbi:MAG: hypothetical protein NWP98_09115 [Erythrobacter sp.]|nr:hypothetical protein [Erythrobacter sp.]